jgi:redox-sensitive bicupin YhaK (pirin superfamily)
MNAVTQSAPTRAVERVVEAQVAPVGTFTVRRALPDRLRHSVGPWVFLDHFGPFAVKPGDGVGPHPHAGIETVTYLLSGRQQHRDSAGHVGIVNAGGAQWMTAGRGIVHAETPKPETEAERTLHGIQLWTTLPRALKNTAPDYQKIDASTVAERQREGERLRVVAGELDGLTGPARTRMPTLLAHLTLAPGNAYEAAWPQGYEAGIYVIEGVARIDGATNAARTGQFAVLDDEGDAVRLENTGDGRLEVLLLGGAPAEGPLVFHGPFVMNSVAQVRTAEKAYMTGAMGWLAA